MENQIGKFLIRAYGRQKYRLHVPRKNRRPAGLAMALILLVLLPILAVGCGRSPGTVTNASNTVTTEPAKEASTSATTEPAKEASTAATTEPERSGTKFPDFSMKDLDGNVVDQTIFATRDMTLVNIWGTFCPPCIDEMPDLGKLAKVMESDYNAQLIGLVVDITDADTHALAKEILSRSNAEHLNLIPDDAVSKFLSQFEYVPTSIFVDKEGYVVGQPVVGGHSYGDYLVLVKDTLGK